MAVEVRDNEDEKVIVLDGDIDMTKMKGIKEELLRIIENVDKNVVIDFSNVDYIDSSGVGVLIIISKELKKTNKSLRLINLSDRISKILELSSLQEVIQS